MSPKDRWYAWIAKNPLQSYLEVSSVADIAIMLDVSKATVYYWLSGERIPSSEHLKAMESLGFASAASYARWLKRKPNSVSRLPRRLRAVLAG